MWLLSDSLRRLRECGFNARPGGLSRAAKVIGMSEENNPKEQQEQHEPIKTAADVKLEELAKRLDALEKENTELRSANKELYNAARTAPTEQQAPAQQAPAKQEPTFGEVRKEQSGPDEAALDRMTDGVLSIWHLDRKTKE
jgi:hypothetical protein